MNLFEEVDEDLFRPLTGINKRKYVDLLALTWDKCKRMPMYAVEKSTIFDMAEEYFLGLDEQIELDDDEREELDNGSSDARIIATGFVRRLRDTGWLIEKEGEYEQWHYRKVNGLHSRKKPMSCAISVWTPPTGQAAAISAAA